MPSTLTYIFPFRFWKWDFTLQNEIINFLICLSSKGWFSSEQYIQDNTQRPDITFIVIFFFNDLWSHIVYLDNILTTLPTLIETLEFYLKEVPTPKSMILMSFSCLFKNMMFSGFRSRCMILLEWQ